MKTLKITLWVAIFFMAYLVYSSIMTPINFEKEKQKRYTDAIGNLIDIRNSQVAYKSINGRYASKWESLVEFIDTAKYILTSRKDTSYYEYDKVYLMDMLVEKVLIDTLGFMPVKDSLFKDKPLYKTMMNVPNIDGTTFELKTAILTKNGIKVPVFVARVKKKDLLAGMDSQLVLEAIDAFDVKGDYLQVGDLEQSNISGNWPKPYEPNFK